MNFFPLSLSWNFIMLKDYNSHLPVPVQSLGWEMLRYHCRFWKKREKKLKTKWSGTPGGQNNQFCPLTVIEDSIILTYYLF